MSETTTTTMASESKTEIEMVRCECCDLTEECTATYIENIRRLYAGKWICGLCSEAVKYEIFRRGKQRGVAGVDEALAGHKRFCCEFRSSSAAEGTKVDVISALMQVFRRRGLDSPRMVRSAPASPVKNNGGGGGNCTAVLGRTGSCLPTFSGGL